MIWTLPYFMESIQAFKSLLSDLGPLILTLVGCATNAQKAWKHNYNLPFALILPCAK